MSDQKNLILAIILSVGIVLGFQYFFEGPRTRDQLAQQDASQTLPPGPPGSPSATQAPGVPGAAQVQAPVRDRAQTLAATARLPIDNRRINGSIAMTGGRFDDLSMADYRLTTDRSSPEVVLLSPPGTQDPYFVEFGWVSPNNSIAVPDQRAVWQTESQGLSTASPARMTWDNGAGLAFDREVSIDADYMVTLKRRVTNNGTEPVVLHPYGLISRWGTPQTQGYYVLHEGPIGVLEGKLQELSYADLVKQPHSFKSTGGWLGIGDKYWLVALVPQQDRAVDATFRAIEADGQVRYQVDYLEGPVTIAPGASAELIDRFFGGAKEAALLDTYASDLNIPLFDRAVDFGWFPFLTKPMFYVLHFFNRLVGNYGLAIMLLTLCVKAIFFPLADKSYRAMAKMKALQPMMTELREKYGDDKVKMNQELMALYKREKVNPLAGCLPIVVQIPVFFALYKVIFINIEMRHAPFFGWITDLSAPDPTTIFNLFGLIPWTPPHFLMIGVWPLAMGFTMWLQQRLNPQPADPMQAKVMSFLPVMFTFLFATFPAGLVIYWTWNNLLSIAQQWVILKKMGVKVT